MFAVLENICIFVIAKVTYKFREINRFHIQNRDKRGVSWYLFFTELIGLWRVNRNAPLHSFMSLTVNLDQCQSPLKTTVSRIIVVSLHQINILN